MKVSVLQALFCLHVEDSGMAKKSFSIVSKQMQRSSSHPLQTEVISTPHQAGASSGTGREKKNGRASTRIGSCRLRLLCNPAKARGWFDDGRCVHTRSLPLTTALKRCVIRNYPFCHHLKRTHSNRGSQVGQMACLSSSAAENGRVFAIETIIHSRPGPTDWENRTESLLLSPRPITESFLHPPTEKSPATRCR